MTVKTVSRWLGNPGGWAGSNTVEKNYKVSIVTLYYVYVDDCFLCAKTFVYTHIGELKMSLVSKPL